jgi:hypothetical protein
MMMMTTTSTSSSATSGTIMGVGMMVWTRVTTNSVTGADLSVWRGNNKHKSWWAK